MHGGDEGRCGMLKYYMYKYLTFKNLKRIFFFVSVLFLSGCEKDDDTSLGEDDNFNNQADCWQSSLLSIVSKNVDTLLRESAGLASSGGAAVVCIGFAIWMSFKLLKILPSFKEQNLGEVWTEILQKLFFCAFFAVTLTNVSNINYLINLCLVPIYQTLVELGAAIVSGGSFASEVNVGEFGVVTYVHNANACQVSGLSAESIGSGLSNSVGCLVCLINDRLSVGLKIGIALICTGNIGAILVGLFVLFVFTVTKIFFVLVLVDSIFRLNFAGFLVPFLIICIPFNYTRKWAKQGALLFLNSAGVIMFLALLIAVCIGAMQNIIIGIGGDGLKEEDIEGLGTITLSIFMISVLFINIPCIAEGLADKYVEGGAGLEFQKRISRFVFTAARSAAASILGTFTNGIAQEVNKVIEKHEKLRAMKEHVAQVKSSVSSKFDSLAGYNDDDS